MDLRAAFLNLKRHGEEATLCIHLCLHYLPLHTNMEWRWIIHPKCFPRHWVARRHCVPCQNKLWGVFNVLKTSWLKVINSWDEWIAHQFNLHWKVEWRKTSNLANDMGANLNYINIMIKELFDNLSTNQSLQIIFKTHRYIIVQSIFKQNQTT